MHQSLSLYPSPWIRQLSEGIPEAPVKLRKMSAIRQVFTLAVGVLLSFRSLCPHRSQTPLTTQLSQAHILNLHSKPCLVFITPLSNFPA